MLWRIIAYIFPDYALLHLAKKYRTPILFLNGNDPEAFL